VSASRLQNHKDLNGFKKFKEKILEILDVYWPSHEEVVTKEVEIAKGILQGMEKDMRERDNLEKDKIMLKGMERMYKQFCWPPQV
jgi:hypothetical protein